jgi:hypothetical protein
MSISNVRRAFRGSVLFLRAYSAAGNSFSWTSDRALALELPESEALRVARIAAVEWGADVSVHTPRAVLKPAQSVQPAYVPTYVGTLTKAQMTSLSVALQDSLEAYAAQGFDAADAPATSHLGVLRDLYQNVCATRLGNRRTLTEAQMTSLSVALQHSLKAYAAQGFDAADAPATSHLGVLRDLYQNVCATRLGNRRWTA